MNTDLQERLKKLSPEKRERIVNALREEAALQGKFHTIPKRPRQDSAQLSFAQQRLWFLHQLEPNLSAYNFLLAARLEGELDLAALRAAFRHLVGRHETLRTTFALRGGEPRQLIAPALDLPLPCHDLRDLPAPERERAAQARLRAELARPFDLAAGPLLRAEVLRLGEREHLAVVALHHIICDGWSLGVLLRELGEAYAAAAGGVAWEGGELGVQYGDYAEWQRGWLRGEELERQLGYWRGRLGGMRAVEVRGDRARPPAQSFRGAYHSFELPADLSGALRELSKRQNVTLFMTLLAAFQTLLYRYTGQEDIVVSSGISDRSHPETEALIGCFINILLLRSDLSGEPSFLELLGRVREVALEAYAHQDLPFELLVEALRPERDLSYNPLTQVMFVLHNTPFEVIKFKDLTLSPVTVERNAAQLDLNLQIWERADKLTGILEYDTDLFDATTISRLIEHFRILLEGIVAEPRRRLWELPLLTRAEQEWLLVRLNETQAEFPEHSCLHQLFEAQAEQNPQAVAVIYEDTSLTYGELNRRANQLAHHLRALGVGPDAHVGIFMERSPEMVVGLLAVLKAGGAYVPLDPAYPKERLAFMLRDAQVSVLLTQSHLTGRLPEQRAELVLLDADRPVCARHSEENLNSGVMPENLAYVIYTSGSTGVPKAAMLDHRGRVNNFCDFNRRYRIGPEDRLIALSSPSFDMTAYDVFGTLMSGGAIVLPRASAQLEPSHGAELMRRHGVSVWHSAPALLELLVQHLGGRPEAAPGSLRLALLGGDWIPLSLPGRLKALIAGIQVVGMGGATEVSMDSTIYDIQSQDPGWKSIPYGKPMANQTCYVLDAHLQPVPVGVPGELHLGGVGLAWGYLHQPALSAEKFIPHPFSVRPGARLYRTGDLARYLPDGNLELLGRIDHQVKLRGFRIELGEVAAALRQHPVIKEAIATIREDEAGNRFLVAYAVPGQEPAPRPSELRGFLKKALPDYMVPAFVVILEHIPLTPNGKVDRRSLPAPDTSRREVEAAFVAPRTPVEEVVAGIWADVLGREQVGVHDNFFDIGGHSLLATQVVSRLRESFYMELLLRHIFESPTVSQLARQIESDGSAAGLDVVKIAQILVRLNSLSESEARRELDEKGVQAVEAGEE